MTLKTYPLPSAATEADAVILADGDYPQGIAAAILTHARYVVCCDGAADGYVAHGGTPSAIVGDCDSLSASTARRYSDIIHPSAEQETNDLTKAVAFCLARGLRSIVILGATGRREDHTLGNLSLLADYVLAADVQMITNTGVFDAIHSPARFESLPGGQVSIVTIGTATRVTVEGLLYTPPADGLCGWWRATLNEALGDEFTITTDGPTLVFRAF